MISVCFQGKPFNITVIQAYAPATNAKEVEVEWFDEDVEDLIELTLKKKKRVLFIIEGQSRKSRDTSNNRQVWPWSAN